MNKNEEIKKELEDYDPAIRDRAGYHSFKVPEGYFESLQDSVLGRIENEEFKREKRKPKIFRLWYGPAAAAAMIVVVFAVWFMTRESNINRSNTFSGIESEEYLQYLEEEGDWADFELLYEEGLVDGEQWLESIPDEDLDELIDEFLEEEDLDEDLLLNI